ncbi:MAG: hypothetical protein ACRDR6_28690 [Pseudonocardiaceae bacterium]
MTEFRFSYNIFGVHSRDDFVETCRRGERYGYDTVFAADHLGITSPFPALVAAAGATQLLAATVSEDEGVVLGGAVGECRRPRPGFGAGPWWSCRRCDGHGVVMIGSGYSAVTSVTAARAAVSSTMVLLVA